MAASAEYVAQPFQAAIDYFRGKVPLPTERWTDLWEGMHARAFTVAGATREALLCDIRQAVDKAISQGTTLETFRKDFSQICARHGWSPRGGQDFRARVIYETNLSTSYAAGHYKRMTDPDVRDARPYWRYVRSSSEHPRPEHLAWVGITLPWDHPWWERHYPPNGWGCKCGVVSCSPRELRQLQAEEAAQRATGEDVTTPIRTEAPPESTYEWTDRRTGEVRQVPKGIDPGWAYNPGKAAWGEQQAREVMDAWAAGGEQTWERVTDGVSGGDWRSAGRPAAIPVDAPRAKLGRPAASREDLVGLVREAIGGEQAVFGFEAASGFRYDLAANAAVLGEHMDPARAPFVPYLRETIEDPFEVWMSFERNRLTGQVRLSTRFIKRVDINGERGLLLVAQATRGVLEAWTMLPVRAAHYLGKQRTGMLLWGRPLK